MFRIRTIGYLLVAATLLGVGIDAGSVVLTTLSLPEQVREAGQAGSTAVEGQPVTRETARVALAAAVDEAATHGVTVPAKRFTLFPDGRVELTGARTAPTLLLERFALLRHFTRTRATETVTALPFN